MEFRSYNREIKFATAQVIDVFNNIVIYRMDKNNNIQTKIEVPCLYGNAKRELKSLSNRNKTIKLPLMAISIESWERDTERVHSVNDRILFETGTTNLNYNMAVPITVTYNLSIIAKYQEDLEQITGNFMSIMNPDIYVVIPHPKNTSKLKTQLVWEGSLNIEYPDEIDETSPWRLMADGSLTCKTWLFPGDFTTWNSISGLPSNVNEDVGLIKSINIYGSNNDICSANPIVPDNKLGNWYDVPTYMEFSEYYENILSGYIQAPNFDSLPIYRNKLKYDYVSGYWNNLWALSGNTSYSPNISADLNYIINNFNNLEHYISGTTFLPEYMTTGIVYNIYTEMLSGDLTYMVRC